MYYDHEFQLIVTVLLNNLYIAGINQTKVEGNRCHHEYQQFNSRHALIIPLVDAFICFEVATIFFSHALI